MKKSAIFDQLSGISCYHYAFHEEVKWSEVTQLSPTLFDPVDCSPPSSSVRGILQARVLEWVAISSSQGSSLNQGSHPSLLQLLHCRQILYQWATWEGLVPQTPLQKGWCLAYKADSRMLSNAVSILRLLPFQWVILLSFPQVAVVVQATLTWSSAEGISWWHDEKRARLDLGGDYATSSKI